MNHMRIWRTWIFLKIVKESIHKSVASSSISAEKWELFLIKILEKFTLIAVFQARL